MGPRTLVERNIDEGARLLSALDSADVPVDAVFWLLSSEWSDWRLVVATPLYKDGGSDEAYRQILGVHRDTDDTDTLYGCIAVARPDDRRVRAIRSLLRNGLPWPGFRLDGAYAEDVEIIDSYIYRLNPRTGDVEDAAGVHARPSRNGAVAKRKASMKSDR
jgi:hypothetical protein